MSILQKKTVEVYLNHDIRNNTDFTESVIIDFCEMIEKFKELKDAGFKLDGQPTVQKDVGSVFLSYKFTLLDSKLNEFKEKFISFDRSYFEKIQLSPEPNPETLNKSVEELDFSIRTYNCLKDINVQTLRDLVQKTEKELLESKNFGRKSLNEIKEILAGMGLSLRK